MNTGKPMYKWNELNWRKLEKSVFKLQKRIYQATNRGDVKTVRKLQKLLLKSWAAKCLAVRKVTQDNQGKKTAGVDGIKSLSPEARLKLVGQLKLTGKSKPTRRVWIPKPGRKEKRPLGIPTIYDRALQALVKLALEPEWEAKFEPNSYGFRPGRSCHDAIEAIWYSVSKNPRYVLDAEIAKCFDRIDHSKLLEKLNTFPTLRKQIRAWLKAGVLDGKELFPTEEGTPQGGVISPLLANIALHGMENVLMEFADNPPKEYKKLFGADGKRGRKSCLTFVRYADDFVILHKNLEIVKKCQEIIEQWLSDIGLKLKPEKTKIAHTLKSINDEKPGFNFLGFRIYQPSVSKYKSGKTQKGYVTHTLPHKEKVVEHYQKLRTIIDSMKSAPQWAIIEKLNPIIKGWSNYYQTGVSKRTFNKLDHLLTIKLLQWGFRRHPKKGKRWVKDKYWKTIGGDHWVFATNESAKLYKHSKTPIERHVKVKGKASPFDGNLTYWSTRLGRHPILSKREAILFHKQEGKCNHCGLFFKDGDLWEIDHIIPKIKGGKDNYENLQILHRHCHDKKTANDGSLCSMRDKHQSVEEPDEVKVSRPVLKTSR